VRGVLAQTKTGRLRVIPLVDKVVKALEALPRTNDLVFPRRNGNPMRPEITLDVLHRTCDRAGVPRIGWHGLRHSFASTMCQRGVPIRDVQELLGHTTIMMTSRYTHTSPKNLQGWLQYSFANEPHDKIGHQVVTTAAACTT
jgi:site-specific recombinase XerD